ncbi:hypothetical protein RKD26_004475 [Streptomyces calvus]
MPGSFIERSALPVTRGASRPRADQPVGLRRRLAQRVLLDQRAEDVRHGLVERAGLAEVRQVRGVLRDAVRELVADDVDGDGEVEEDLAVPVAEDHLLAVPEGVVVLPVVVHRRDHRQAVAVDGVARVRLEEQLERGAQTGVGAVDGGVPAGRVALAADLLARQVGAVPGVVHGAVRLGALGLGERRDGRRADHGGQPALGAFVGVALQGAARGTGEQGIVGLREPVEDVRRDDGAEDGLEAPVVGHTRHHCTV